jgi:hypothetical protein
MYLLYRLILINIQSPCTSIMKGQRVQMKTEAIYYSRPRLTLNSLHPSALSPRGRNEEREGGREGERERERH